MPLSLAGTLLLSVALHALVMALLPPTQTLVTVVKAPLEMTVVNTVKPQPPPAPAPVAKLRAPRAAAKPVAPAENTVRDLGGELEAPTSPEPPPLVFRRPLAPKIEAPVAPEAAAPAVTVTETAAALESEVKPPYPEAARREEAEGTVVLRVTVGEDGRVLDAVVTEDPGYGLGEAARAAVLRARFAPATRGGVRVRTTLTWRYRFELR